MTAGRSLVTLGRPLGASLLLAGLVLAALAAIGASWADLVSAGAERDAKADLLAHGVAASRRAVIGPRAEADPFVVAETATQAAAAIDADLRTLALSTGLTLLSSRAEAKPEEPGSAGSIGTRIEEQCIVEGQNEALQGLLLRLETGTPTVLVDALAIAPVEAEQGAMGDPQAPRLHATLTLSAYWRTAARQAVP